MEMNSEFRFCAAAAAAVSLELGDELDKPSKLTCAGGNHLKDSSQKISDRARAELFHF